MIGLLYLLVFSVVIALIEVTYDRDLDKAFKEDGVVTQQEFDLLHRKWLPARGFMIFMSSFAMTGDMIMLGLAIIFCSAVFWLVFDILAAKMWLGKKWNYIGEREKFQKTHLIIKFSIILLSAYLIHAGI